MAVETGLVAIDTILTSENVEDMTIEFRFCYQATASFNIDVVWAFTESGTGNVTSIYGDVVYQELGGSVVSSVFSSPGLTGSESVTLPASTFCEVTCLVSGTDAVAQASSLDVYLS